MYYNSFNHQFGNWYKIYARTIYKRPGTHPQVTMATNLQANNNKNQSREVEFYQMRDNDDQVRQRLQQEYNKKMKQGRKIKFVEKFKNGDQAILEYFQQLNQYYVSN